ncbi:hypothetical protein FHS43_001634 [Streptosporangium becharense]|uniref:Uncharacterized protein n=1 Tax=Streptosporangium becharense TaxID=1816182 RepID=A0A7W9ILS7_9ACTN|nr:hypothetical protein [Streptosporangium becharense]MBB5823114.1 hypothetical protein [Streptosporangium becharense]
MTVWEEIRDLVGTGDAFKVAAGQLPANTAQPAGRDLRRGIPVGPPATRGRRRRVVKRQDNGREARRQRR